MPEFHYKGQRRAVKDLNRRMSGEPRQNQEHNATPYSKYEKGSKAIGKKKGKVTVVKAKVGKNK